MAEKTMEELVKNVEIQTNKEEQAAALLVDDFAVEETEEVATEEQPEQIAEPVETQEPKVEPKTEEKDETKVQLWGKITAQDKQIRELKQQMKSLVDINHLKEVIKKDPAKVLADLGIGIDQVIDALSQQEGIPVNRVEPKHEDLEIERLKQEWKEMKEMVTQQKQISLVNEELSRIDKTISSNPDRWEVVHSMKAEGSYNLVIETATEMWKQTGTVPNYDIVLDAVEEHLANEAKQRLERLNSIRKFKQTRTPEVNVQTKNIPTVNPNAPTGSQTRLTEEERLERVARLLVDED